VWLIASIYGTEWVSGKLIGKFGTFQAPPSAALQSSQASSIDAMQLMDVLLHIVDFELRELKLMCLVYAMLVSSEFFSLFSHGQPMADNTIMPRDWFKKE
jgi:hypothetical protein